MCYACIIGTVIGLGLIIYFIKQVKKIRNFSKTKATIVNYGTNEDIVYTVVNFYIDQKSVKGYIYDRSIFLKIGKTITIYYNPKKYEEVYCMESEIFVLIMGILFFLSSLFALCQ